MILGKLEGISEEFEKLMNFYKVDVDALDELFVVFLSFIIFFRTESEDVTSFPSFIFYKKGYKGECFVGAAENGLRQLISRLTR